MQSKSDFPDSINTKSRPGSLPEKHASKHRLLRYKSDTIPWKKCELHCRIHHLMSDQLSNCLPSSHSRKKSINLLANIAPGLGSIIVLIFFFFAIYYMICHLSYWKQFIQILIPITRFCHYKIVMYNFTSVFCRLCNKKKIGTTSIKLILFRSSLTNQTKIRQQRVQSAFSMAIYFPSNFEE